MAALLHFSLLCQTSAVKRTLVYIYLLWGYCQGVISCKKNCWLMSVISVKAHLCWHSKYSDSIRSDTCVSFNLNSSCNSSNSAQEQGSAQASLLFKDEWLLYTRAHRNHKLLVMLSGVMWRCLFVLQSDWGGSWSEQTAHSAEGTLSGYWVFLTTLPVSCLNSEWDSLLLTRGLGETTSRHLPASCCAPYNLLGPMVLSLDVI